MLPRALQVVLVAAAVLGPLFAHGGQYRGRFDSPPTPGQPPDAPGVNTGARPIAPDSVAWETWWEFNKEPFLQRRALADGGPTSGSDDFYLGARRREVRVDLLAPTDDDLEKTIVPELAALLRKEKNRDIATACLVGLGKIGRDGPRVELEPTITPLIARDDQEVRETAVLALGIAGRDGMLPALLAIAGDTPEGRRLNDRAEVAERTRAFATFGLGLLARRSKDAAIKQQVHDFCMHAITAKDQVSNEVRVAALNAVGVINLDEAKGAQKRLLWQTVDELLDWFGRDLGPADEAAQAHAAIAISRLLGRGATALHQRSKERFADELQARHKRGVPVRRAAVIALGAIVEPAENEIDDGLFSRVLQTIYEKGSDQHERLFSLVSLGRIGGATNREFLLKAYARGNKSSERPWAAIGLGLQAFERGSRGDVDESVSRILLEDLVAANEESLRGALGIAIGLIGDPKAAPVVRKVLTETERDQVSAGYLCTSLALLGDRDAVPLLGDILDRSVRRAFLMTNCAVALGLLGDREAATRLAAQMQKSDSVAVLASLATAIGRIGDRRSIAPLVELLHDEERTKLARAFVAAALGGIGDKDAQPWNVPFSVDCYYSTPTETLANGSNGILDIL
ncbi:MAG: HEAT repeat domain-containing protein [Planctomycetota bacterium]